VNAGFDPAALRIPDTTLTTYGERSGVADLVRVHDLQVFSVRGREGRCSAQPAGQETAGIVAGVLAVMGLLAFLTTLFRG